MRPIGMDDMNAIFEVTDDLEIDREAIQVSLLPAGEGSVRRLEDGTIEIVLPAERPVVDWLPELRRRLQELGAGDD